MNIDEKTIIVILTCNGEKTIKKLLKSLQRQKKQKRILVIDSESDDSTIKIISEMKMNIKIKKICRSDFNHGKTRQMAIDMCRNAEYFVFLTQDVIIAENDAIEKLLTCFENKQIGCAYGRQLPHKNAGILGAHARLFNYSKQSQIKKMEDAKNLGIKTIFISDSFAAYRRKALEDVGGFPRNVILSEDSYVAAKMLMNGWDVFYCAEAMAYHSHDYTIVEEFKRYFDIGVFHAREAWIREEFGKAEKEGMRFIFSEFKYAFSYGISLIPSLILRNLLKYLGYQLGLKENIISLRLKRKISMCGFFWE